MSKKYKQIDRCIKDKDGKIIALCTGMTIDEEKKLIKKYPGSYYSTL